MKAQCLHARGPKRLLSDVLPWSGLKRYTPKCNPD